MPINPVFVVPQIVKQTSGEFYTKGKSDGQQKSNNSVFIYVK